MTKAYSYLRFSSARQAIGSSLERQFKASRAYAEAQGWTLDESLVDRGISAYHGKNATEGNLGRFLVAIESGKVPVGSILIVESLDRLSRQHAMAAQTLFNRILMAGVEIVTLMDGQRYSRKSIEENPLPLILSLVTMIRAHEESQVKSKRSKAAVVRSRHAATVTKTPITSRAPFWLTIPKVSEVGRGAPRKFKIIPEQAALVRRIFKLSIELGLGYYRIANKLNTEGVKAPLSKNGWHPSSLKKLLQNEAVIGTFRPGRMEGKRRITDVEPIEDYYPAILEKETFYRAQSASMSRGGGKARGRRALGAQNLFHGLLRCGVCKGPMIWLSARSATTGANYYQCRSARYGQGCDHRNHHRVGTFTRTLFQNIHEFVFENENGEAKQRQDHLVALDAQIEDLKVKRSRWMDRFEGGDDSVDERIRSLTNQIKTIEMDRDKLNRDHQIRSSALDRSHHASSAGALYAKMSSLTGTALIDARSRLSTDMRELIEDIAFTPTEFVVVLRNDRDCYIFRDDELFSVAPRHHLPDRENKPEPTLVE